MTRPNPEDVSRIAVVGAGGLIGASWVAFFLSRGIDVVAQDPAAGAEQRLNDFITRTKSVLPPIGPGPGRLQFEPDLDRALAGVEFVQENAPENEAIKTEIFTRLDALTSPEVILASSTSSLLRSRLVVHCQHPARCIMAHPINPPHLMPLVEIVAENDAVADWASRFYAFHGKKPVVLKREAVGHIANRLASAMWREAVFMVEQGIATVEDIDTAVTNGPGLRMAVMGPTMLYHTGGGPGGLEQYLKHLGSSQERRWADLGSPTLSPEVQRQLIEGVRLESRGKSVEELELQRDNAIRAILRTRELPSS